MEQPKTRPVWETPYGGAQVPAEAQQHVTWATAVLAGFIERRDAQGAIRYAAGFMSTVVANVMRGKAVSADNAGRAYALYHVAMGLEVDGWSTGKDVDPTAALIGQPVPAPAADASGYRLANYSGPLRLIEAPCGCGTSHIVPIPARPVGAL